jgi:hypothetical protein
MPDSVISVELAGGAPRSRLDKVGGYYRVGCQWVLTPDDYTYIQNFYRVTTKQGSMPFIIELIIEDSSVRPYKAYFVANSLKLTEQRGLRYVVTAELRVAPGGQALPPPPPPPPPPTVTTLSYSNGGQLNQTSFLWLLTTPPSNSLTVGDFSITSVANGVSTSIGIAAVANLYAYYASSNNQAAANFYAGQYVLAVDLDTPNNTAAITHDVTVIANINGQQASTQSWAYLQPYAAPQAAPSVMTLGADRVDNTNISQFNIRSFGEANEFINVVFTTDTRLEPDGVFTCKRDGVVVPFYGSSIEKYGTHYRKTTFADQTDIPQGFPLKTKQYLTAPATITAFDDAGAFLQDNVHQYSIYVPVGDHIGTYTVSYSSSTTLINNGISFTLTA